MLLYKLALKNLIGGRLRTWLNVFTLSLSFVAIIWMQGMYKGMYNQVKDATTAALYGGGQYWQQAYDPYDPLTIDDAHAPIPKELNTLIETNKATAILVRRATIYPNGRMKTIMMKGIDPAQKVLTIPSEHLNVNEADYIPALIGSRMASETGLKKDDFVTIQWRDANGTFDASELKIVQVMKTTVQEIDNGQVWIPLDYMQRITAMPNEATTITMTENGLIEQEIPNWSYKSLYWLLTDLRALVESKQVGGSVMYVVLLFLAMLAIFDTQVLSIFRRRKEIGTLMALGMTRFKVVRLFTIEGAMHGVLAAVMAAVYGIPLLANTAIKGIALPASNDDYGIALGEKLFPVYGVGLVLGTIILVMLVTTIVSFMPTRKIAKLDPTDALRGKIS